MRPTTVGIFLSICSAACPDRRATPSAENRSLPAHDVHDATCFRPAGGTCRAEAATDANRAACTDATQTPPDPGEWADRCPTENLIGCCLTPDPHVYDCAYRPSRGAPPDPEQNCVSKTGGTWVTSPP